MNGLPLAQSFRRKGEWTGEAEACALTYDERFLRRKKLTLASGRAFVVDLAQTTSLNDGDALELDTGECIAIEAAAEPLLQVEGQDLARLAWHIGNRHTPCQVEGMRLLIQNDPVIAHMLEHLGAQLREVVEPFNPEGGAYGHGRTHSHEHGQTSHDH